MSSVPIQNSFSLGNSEELQEEALDLSVAKQQCQTSKNKYKAILPTERTYGSSSQLNESVSSQQQPFAGVCGLCGNQFKKNVLELTIFDDSNFKPLYGQLAQVFPKLSDASQVSKYLKSCPDCSSYLKSVLACHAYRQRFAADAMSKSIIEDRTRRNSSPSLNQYMLSTSASFKVAAATDMPRNMKNLSLDTSEGNKVALGPHCMRCSICHVETNLSKLFPLSPIMKSSNGLSNHITNQTAPVCYRCLQLLSISKVNSGNSPSHSKLVKNPVFRDNANAITKIDANCSTFNEFLKKTGYEKGQQEWVKKNGHLSGLQFFETPPDQNDELKLATTVCQRPLKLKIFCYICGMHSQPGFTYCLNSKPSTQVSYYFPFLEKIVPGNPDAQFDDYCLVCTICFHSLLKQWYKKEKLKEKIEHREYNTKDFTCYICSMVTYRKRTNLIRVKDFPFLKDHVPPPGGLVLNDGRFVNACQDCFVTLKDQYSDMEKCGLPVEKRQYNWIKKLPPPETDSSVRPIGRKSSLKQPMVSKISPLSGNLQTGLPKCVKPDSARSFMTSDVAIARLHGSLAAKVIREPTQLEETAKPKKLKKI